MSIGSRIKESREKHGFTQANLGALLERSATFVADIEANRRPVSKYLCKLVARILVVNPEWLRKGDSGLEWIVQSIQGGWRIVAGDSQILVTDKEWVAREVAALHNEKAKRGEKNENSI